MFYTNTRSPVNPDYPRRVLALLEAYLYAGLWGLLSRPRGGRLASTRLGRWVERKAAREREPA